ncbi:Crossover junction endonuclease MUS81 [Mucuna pruriens]|uniref:Crossover junction endonuclease MUS81 n=1 Tax=Mucuna pruriens TaxID=157652 RepID=A0A371FXL7_MUCPR|nr:Crossover junction endonuclease MUS81 [Mucuna pruriens]
MENRNQVRCPENQELASYVWNKWKEMVQQPKGISDNIEMTLSKAHFNVCNSKTPIRTIKDFSQVKVLISWCSFVFSGRGVGKMILKLMQGFFGTSSCASEPEDLTKKGKKTKGTKRYMPQRNSVAYALLITLYRGTSNGNEFMHKQELIDAAEASGLSRVPIAPENGKGKPGHFGSSARDWYSGWNCMKTLIAKGLVVKSSCPAKYMLTQEGKEAACDCLARSGMAESLEKSASIEISSYMDNQNSLDVELNGHDLESEVLSPLTQQKKPMDVPLDCLERRPMTSSSHNKRESISIIKTIYLSVSFGHQLGFETINCTIRETPKYHFVQAPAFQLSWLVPIQDDQFTQMGYSKEHIISAFTEVSRSHPNKDVSSLWPAVLCHLREEQVYGSKPESLRSRDLIGKENRTVNSSCGGHVLNFCSRDIPPFPLRACSSAGHPMQNPNKDELVSKMNILNVPPLSLGERFEDAYDIILVLDDREQFATQGSRSRKIIDNIRNQFKIQIEVRRLPVGDGIWLARHKTLDSEYVLDFIVERKKIDDLRSSIRDNRYKDQKLRLLRCGLKKLIYLVEGDPNSSEAAESIKTACFTTEILEGFDVQRTSGLGDTLRKYGYLTQAISQYYKSENFEDNAKCSGTCPPFDEFIKRCQDLEKTTVSDVFAIQLMQVPQVTEEVAMAVLDLFPTLFSLARAYSQLDGDTRAQEEMLRRQSNNEINVVASRNIFQFVWDS